MARILNVELKARTARLGDIREILNARGARYVGRDRQVDTYFHCAEGRLKLREGTMENALIFYRRPDDRGLKRSDISLERLSPGHGLTPLLSEALGVRVAVDKQREIYFIDNVKFHLDEVRGLGSFIEIEAIDESGEIGEETLRRQCNAYMAMFGIAGLELVSGSYSDLLLELGHWVCRERPLPSLPAARANRRRAIDRTGWRAELTRTLAASGHGPRRYAFFSFSSALSVTSL